MKASYRYDDYTVMDYIDSRHKYLVPVTVVTDALDVPNSKYIVQVKSKTQKDHNSSIWKLKFHEYYEDNLSFEKFYTEKTVTLSADYLELLKYQKIDANSPTSAILALQRKLDLHGSFKPYYENNKARYPNGVWESAQMVSDIYHFQMNFMNTGLKQGRCDRDTINALVNMDNYTFKEGRYDRADLVWDGKRYRWY